MFDGKWGGVQNQMTQVLPLALPILFQIVIDAFLAKEKCIKWDKTFITKQVYCSIKQVFLSDFQQN